MASSTHVGPSRQSRSFKPTATSLTSLQDHSVGEETLKAGVPGGGGSSFYPPPFYNTLPLLLRPILLRLSLPHPDHHCPLPNLHQDQNGRALALYLWNQAMYAPPPPLSSPSPLPPSTQSGMRGSHQKPGTRNRQLSLPRGVRYCHTLASIGTKIHLSPYSLKNQKETIQKPKQSVPSSAPSQGLKCFGCLRVNKQAGLSPMPPIPTPEIQVHVSPEAQPVPLSPHGVYSKGKRKESKKSEWVRAQGPTPTPLQATPNRLLGKQGRPRPRGVIPISGSVQRILVFSITANTFHPSPATPGWGRGCTLSTY